MLALELCATISGIAYLYYAIRQRTLCWAYYIISAIAYVPVFLQSGLYLYAIFQLLFMLAGVAGLLLWGKREDCLPIRRMTLGTHTLYNFFSLAALIPGLFLLPRTNGLPNLLCDCFLSIYTLTTTILTTRKYVS